MMQIRLASDANRHLVIDRSMLDDPRLSFRAKGLLAYLLAHPGIDVANKKLLTSVSLEGMDAVNTALKELEEAGYFRVIQEPDEEGSVHRRGVVYPVSRIPVLEAQVFTDAAEPAAVKPLAIKGAVAKTNTDSPAQRIVDRLNELRKTAWDWARYTPISAKYAKNVEHITGRLAEGYDEADLILVLEYLSAVDGGKEESRKYFDCVTPFNTKNFERNVAMARDWDAKGRPASTTPWAAHRIIGRLNELRKESWKWVVYTPLSPTSSENTQNIGDRLRDGFQESDLLLVLEYLAITEGGKEESRRYFDCVTPFNTKNFERTLAMARDWDAKGRLLPHSGGSVSRAEGHDLDIYKHRLQGDNQ